MDKRKDNKKRALNIGEYQESSGRFLYKYIDISGKRKTLYSWRLNPSDPLPAGKKADESLREKEKVVMDEMEQETNPSMMTFDTLFNKYINYRELNKNRKKISLQTLESYKTQYRNHIKTKIGEMRVQKIVLDDIETLYMDYWDDELSYTTIKRLHSIINQCFDYAMKNLRLISQNPCDGAIIGCNDRKKVHALSVKQVNDLLDFIGNHKRYYRIMPIVVFLVYTGCRISEAVALQWNEVDFRRKVINIKYSLNRICLADGGTLWKMDSPKSEAGYRTIPMVNEVERLLKEIKQKQTESGMIKSAKAVDGYDQFVFRNSNNNMLDRTNVNSDMRELLNEYNSDKKRSHIDRLTCHVLRHTFISELCRNENDRKIVKTIAGHSDYRVTDEVYDEVFTVDLKKSMKKMNGKFLVAAKTS